MSFSGVLLLIVGFILVGIVIAYLTISKLDKQDNSAYKFGIAKKPKFISIPHYLQISKILSTNAFTRGRYIQIENKISLLAVYSPIEIKIEATKFYLISNAIFIIVTFTGFLIYNNLLSILLISCVGSIVKNVLIDKRIDKVYMNIYEELSIALSSVKHSYMSNKIVSEAIGEAEVGDYLQRPFSDLYDLLNSNNSIDRLELFIRTTPFKLIQTLANVSYYINEKGDENHTAYLNALNMLSDECNLEIRKLVNQKLSFGNLEYLCLVPIPAMALIEFYITKEMPGTSSIYNGILGYVSRIAIVFSGVYAYTKVSKANRVITVSPDDRLMWVQKLLKNKHIDIFLDSIKPKKFYDVLDLKERIEYALSLKTIKHLLLESIIYSFLTFILGLIATFYIINVTRNYIHENVTVVSVIGSEQLTYDEMLLRKEMDNEILARPLEPTWVELSYFVSEHMPKLTQYEHEEQVNRILRKYQSYHSTIFHWWYMVIILILSIGASRIPYINLSSRENAVYFEVEEDVMQMQTLLAILMETSIDTLDVLEWLARQSTIHKAILTICYHEYAYDSELALARLKSKTTSEVFKRIIERLTSTIHRLSLKDAFIDLVEERTQILILRGMMQQSNIETRRANAGYLTMLPLGILLVLHFLAPIGILGFTEFNSSMGSI